MEEISEAPPEGEIGPQEGQLEEVQALDEITFQPEAELERGGNVEEAEAVEAAFVELVDRSAEIPEIPGVSYEEGEKEEYRVLVKFPWIGDAEDEDEETYWSRVATFMTDGDGTWYLPDVEDEVLADTGDEVLADTGEQVLQADDIHPAGADDGDEGEGRD